jgi:hypothetical protein
MLLTKPHLYELEGIKPTASGGKLLLPTDNLTSIDLFTISYHALTNILIELTNIQFESNNSTTNCKSCVLIMEAVGVILNTAKPGNHCTAWVGYSPFQQQTKEKSVHKPNQTLCRYYLDVCQTGTISNQMNHLY